MFLNECWARHSINTDFITQTTSEKPQKHGHHKKTTKPRSPHPHMAEGDVIIYHISLASVSYNCQLCVAQWLVDLSCGSAPVFFQSLVKSIINSPSTSIPRFPTTVHHMSACRTINDIFRKKKYLKEASHYMHINQGN